MRSTPVLTRVFTRYLANAVFSPVSIFAFPVPPHPHSRAMLRRVAVALCLFASTLSGAEPTPTRAPIYNQVEIAPTKTSIYIGTVSMTMPPFSRVDGRFTSRYAAKVFPYFFYNENGTLAVDVSDAQLAALERGEPIDFIGQAVAANGEERRVEGRATPADPTSGKIKVRVFVTKRIQLIFNTTYRFTGPGAATPAPR